MITARGDVRLSHFRIACVDGTSVTNQLYANGRHQCELIIEVSKELKNKVGRWENIKLTEQEQASVTIVAAGPDRMLPVGWTCDEKRNIFDLGVLQLDVPEITPEQTKTPIAIDTGVERIKRYMRFEFVDVIESVNFIAQIVLGGQIYTTSLSTSGYMFDSSVWITPMLAPRLGVDDLKWDMDGEAYELGGADVWVYYWTPPTGFRFVENKGFDNPVRLNNEGDNFQTSYVVGRAAGWVSKGGTVVNKDGVNAPVYMNDIHKGFDLPQPNPRVRFNRYGTIMRAVSVSGNMQGAINEDTSSVWRLLDNFGSEQRYKLTVGASSELLLDDAEEQKFKVGTFRIYLAGGQVEASDLYANGRHQRKIEIEVVKQKELPEGGWIDVSLTDAERASLTITRFSEDEYAPLPKGWSCDKEKNRFDTGLWVRGAEAKLPDDVEHSFVTDSGSEWFERYMRFASGVPIETQRFMAKIVVDGKIYTTYNFSGNHYVIIAPVRPYVIRGRDLIEVHENAFFNPKTKTDIDIYHWLFPIGLRAVMNRGLSSPMYPAYEGARFQTSFTAKSGNISAKGGVVKNSDQVDISVSINDIHRDLPESGTGTTIGLGKHNTIMRAIRMSSTSSLTSGDTRTAWRIWDNFGCEHVFFIWTENDGHGLKLESYN